MTARMNEDIKAAMLSLPVAELEQALLALGWQADMTSSFTLDERKSAFAGTLRLRPIHSRLVERYGAAAAAVAMSRCNAYVASNAWSGMMEATRQQTAKRAWRSLREADLWS